MLAYHVCAPPPSMLHTCTYTHSALPIHTCITSVRWDSIAGSLAAPAHTQCTPPWPACMSYRLGQRAALPAHPCRSTLPCQTSLYSNFHAHAHITRVQKPPCWQPPRHQRCLQASCSVQVTAPNFLVPEIGHACHSQDMSWAIWIFVSDCIHEKWM